MAVLGSEEERARLMSDEPEKFMGLVRAAERENKELEERFYQFCEMFWPAIQEVAIARANAGQQTQNVSLLRLLGFDVELIGSMSIDKFLRDIVADVERVQPWTLAELSETLDKAKATIREQLKNSH